MSPFTAQALADGLSTERLGRVAEFHGVLVSTNDRALEMLDGPEPHGTLVVADSQRAGRGRRGNPWHSPAGVAIHATVIVRGTRPVAAPVLLVAAAGLGIAEGIDAATGLSAEIKWPNDVWVGGRKVAGVLVEARGYRPAAPACVVGFGVNVSHRPGDFPPGLRDSATSLASALGRAVDRIAVLRAILEALEPRLDQALGEAPEGDLHAAYRARSLLLGRRVELKDGEARLRGTVADLSASDGLLLRADDGSVRHVRAEHAADVRPV